MKRVQDLVGVFRASPSGNGARRVEGSPDYRTMYFDIRRKVHDILMRLQRSGEIGWSDLQWDNDGITSGDSARSRPGFDIRINRRLEPSAAAADYITAINQAKVAASACTMVHEAIHLACNITMYPEEDTACRTMQLLLWQDLTQGVPYQSAVTGTALVAQFNAACQEAAVMNGIYGVQEGWLRRHQLIDYVLNNTREYRGSITSEWVRRTFDWWGGMGNRWTTTRAFYIMAFAGSGSSCADPNTLLRVLESFENQQQWQQAKPRVDMEQVRRALQAQQFTYGFAACDRIRAVQDRLHENFGIARGPH